ncbi:MAG: polyphosphate kinase 2 [Flavobacteriales bacterium]|nr:polyphosphate kinase 2 [Flavobacteriales bacterium]
MFNEEDLRSVKTRKEFLDLAVKSGANVQKAVQRQSYEDELSSLQEELVKLQKWIFEEGLRVAVVFEGRDAAGKGGAIKRFMEHLNPRLSRIVALSKPTQLEAGQWYFRRYIKELPNRGEMVFFDRSWYNRAVVEPVMGFCDKQQYDQFMVQVPEFEHMLYEDGVKVIKFWFSISKEEQVKRFASRLGNPLKEWKYSPVDQQGQALWDTYTKYKELMFSRTHTPYGPWVIVRTNDKRNARLESIRYVLSQFDYPEKSEDNVRTLPDPNVVSRYFRKIQQIDT